MRRWLAVAGPLALACTCGEPDDAPTEAAGAPVAAPVAVPSGPVECAQAWSASGGITPRPVDRWERLTLEEAALGLGMTPDCGERERVGGVQTWSCEFVGDPWGFSVALMEYDRVEDAEWAVKEPYPGEVFVRKERHVLQVEARNGPCGEALLQAVLGDAAPESHSPESLKAALEASGWPAEECGSESVDGATSIDCLAFRGDAALMLDLKWEGAAAGARTSREGDDGMAWWWFEHGEATAIVQDALTARALAELMIE